MGDGGVTSPGNRCLAVRTTADQSRGILHDSDEEMLPPAPPLSLSRPWNCQLKVSLSSLLGCRVWSEQPFATAVLRASLLALPDAGTLMRFTRKERYFFSSPPFGVVVSAQLHAGVVSVTVKWKSLLRHESRASQDCSQ